MKKFLTFLIIFICTASAFCGDSYAHRAATKHAVNLLKFKNTENLIKRYCLYPDLYYGKNKDKIEPYLFMDGDVSFHDIPASSITELYQFWIPGKNGQLHRSRKYTNASYLFTEKCFRFYLKNIRKAIDEKRIDDVMQFTGCLIHHMQDATFGLHALEGASGADVYTLNKLSGMDFMLFIANLRPKNDWLNISAEPNYLGDTVEEAVMRLCSQYVKYNKQSCNALFALVANKISKNDEKVFEENTKKIYLTSLYGTLDVLFTVQSWLENRKLEQTSLPLSDLTPYEPPVSGYGEYRFKMLQCRENELEFGVHFEQNLTYHIAENIFTDFTAELVAKNINNVTVNIVNDNKIIDTFTLSGNESKQIKITDPHGVFGFRTKSAAPAGGLIIKQGKFNRKDQK